MSRLQQLVNAGKVRKLTPDEKQEIQRLFLRIALADLRVLRSERSL